MFELLRDEMGQLWFMEFNGRSWGSMALARRVGYEYPAWAASAALGLSEQIHVPASPQNPQRIICRHLGRELLHILFVARGAKSEAFEHWPSLWRSLWDVLRISRNDRWYNWRPDDWRVFFSDLRWTLQDVLSRNRR